MHPALLFIEDSGPLIDLYGDHLGFHDAEVARIELNRGRTDLGEVFLTMDLHMFAIDGVAPESKHFTLSRHCTASFQFESIQELLLEDFNHQNAIMGLTIAAVDPSANNGARMRVEIQPAYGMGASFTCSRCRLIGLRQGDPGVNTTS